MPLIAGTRLGPYEIKSALGAGGMGEVYKARDVRLERTVAIKVLPPQLARDVEFRERFDREAKTISQLTHPHICTLHDVGTARPHGRSLDPEVEEIHFLVLEHLEGETLATRLGRGALPLSDALRIAIEIASALDTAHRHGIIHRDLKPPNVFLARVPGALVPTAKLLDFGLAKTILSAVQPSDSTVAIPSVAGELTAQGTLLGTFQYMAPEQVEGHKTDARTDIFAFGAVLFEMITGKRAFEGGSQASLLTAILRDEPTPISQTSPAAPPALEYVVRTCLAKDPDARFQSAHDVWLQLKWIAESGSGARSVVPAIARRPRPGLIVSVVGAVAVAALASAVTWLLKSTPQPAANVKRFVYLLPGGQNFSRSAQHVVALSHDGSMLAYTANQQLHVRDLSQTDSRAIGTEEDVMEPVFSPDGKWIAYFVPSANGSILKKILTTGGAPEKLAELPGLPSGADWHGSSIFVGVNDDSQNGIFAVPDGGGTPSLAIGVQTAVERAENPTVLDDGTHIMFSIRPDDISVASSIVIQSRGSSDRKVVIEGAGDGRLTASGQIVYARDAAIFAAPFDSRRLAVTSNGVQLIDGVFMNGTTGHFAISADGTLVYRPGSLTGSPARVLTWVDRQGNERIFPARPGTYLDPRFSRDDTKLAVSSERDIWVWRFDKGRLDRVTFTDRAVEYNPVWMGDAHLLFDSTESGAIQIKRKAVDGTGSTDLVRPGPAGYPEVPTPDGRSVIFHTLGNVAMVAPMSPDGQARPLIPTAKGQLLNVEISPNGRWVAYQSNESGQFEIYVRPFPAVDTGMWQVSAKGGRFPLWSRDGSELFFIAGTTMMSARVRVAPSFSPDTPQALFSTAPYQTNIARNYDATKDGRQFVFVKGIAPPAGRSGLDSLVFVTNWFEEVREKMPQSK